MNNEDIKKAKDLSDKVKALGKSTKTAPVVKEPTKQSKDLSFINKLSGFEKKKTTTPEFQSKINIPVKKDEIESAESIASRLNSLEKAINVTVIKGIPTTEEIVAEIKKLTGNNRLDISNIRNGENIARMAQQHVNMNDMRWHGGGISNITGLITAGTNITITGTGTTGDPYVINSSGGGVVEPNYQVVYGTGAGVDSSANFTFDYNNWILNFSDGANNQFTHNSSTGIGSWTLDTSHTISGTGQEYTGLYLDYSAHTAVLTAGSNASPLADTTLTIDWGGTSITGRTAGTTTFLLDKTNGLYQIGDIQASVNGNYFTVDDANNKAYYDNTAHTGKFGINTNAPAQPLHVVGIARITGTGSTATTLTGRDTNTDITNVTVGTGLSLSAGTLTATGIASTGSPLTFSMGNGIQAVASTTSYNTLGAVTLNGTETNRQTVMTTSGTISTLYLVTTTAQPAGGSLVVTVRKNGVATTLTLTVAASAAAGTFTDVTHSFTVVAGDLLSIQYVNNAAAASASMQTIGVKII